EGRGDDRRRGEVRAARVRGPDADRLVGELGRQAVAVRLAVRHDRLDAERPARAQDSQRDLAAVRDQDAAEHQRDSAGAVSSIRKSSWPYSTAMPASTRVAPTTPSAGACTSSRTPSTSTEPSTSPDRTRVPEAPFGP